MFPFAFACSAYPKLLYLTSISENISPPKSGQVSNLELVDSSVSMKHMNSGHETLRAIRVILMYKSFSTAEFLDHSQMFLKWLFLFLHCIIMWSTVPFSAATQGFMTFRMPAESASASHHGWTCSSWTAHCHRRQKGCGCWSGEPGRRGKRQKPISLVSAKYKISVENRHYGVETLPGLQQELLWLGICLLCCSCHSTTIKR